MAELIVEMDGATKAYGPKAGVFDLTFQVPRGQIVGFIGPSGSGKTTCVRLMTGLVAPDSGTVRVLGQSPAAFDSETIAQIGYMPQEALLYPELSLRENLDFAASLHGMPLRRADVIDRLVEFLELGPAMDLRPQAASGGERRRVMLAATLIHQPELLFLDEPTAGIDPVLRRKIWDRLEELADAGRSLVVTTQYVGEAAYCDVVAVLAEGRVVAFETPDDLRRLALGGEVFEIAFSKRPSSLDIESLRNELEATNLEWIGDSSLRAIVDESARAGPIAGKWANDRSIEVVKTGAHVPHFDDVFVALIEKHNNPEEGS